MRAAYYERKGPARDVLRLGEVETPQPARNEVRVRLHTSGVNPSDVKNRAGLTRKIAFARVIPHSDGAGEIESVGDGVPASRVGERVWCGMGNGGVRPARPPNSLSCRPSRRCRCLSMWAWMPVPVSAFPPIPPITRSRDRKS